MSKTRLVLALGLAFVVGIGAGVGGAIGASKLITGQPLSLAANDGAGHGPTPTVSATTGPPPQSPTPTPRSAPTTRYEAGGTFDQGRGNFVLFGGQETPGLVGATNRYFNDTWTWDGREWKLIHPAHSPSARSHHAMVYDAARGVVLLQGGFGNSGFDGSSIDTWSWDGSDWKQLVQPGILPFGQTLSPKLAYDSVRKSVVMLQSGSCPCSYPFDMWNWDGANWTKLATSNPPPPVSGDGNFEMAYLPAIKSAVVFSRRGGSSATWVFDGANRWVSVSSPPASSSSYTIALDERRGVIVLVGNVGDAWTFDGNKWTPIASVGAVPGDGSVMAFDSARGLIIYFYLGAGGQKTLTWDGSHWT